MNIKATMTLPRTLGRMNTTIQKIFRRNSSGVFLEIDLHFLNFLNEDGSLRSSKLDKEIWTGKLWQVAKEGEHSSYGETMHLFPGEAKPTRLICISR